MKLILTATHILAILLLALGFTALDEYIGDGAQVVASSILIAGYVAAVAYKLDK